MPVSPQWPRCVSVHYPPLRRCFLYVNLYVMLSDTAVSGVPTTHTVADCNRRQKRHGNYEQRQQQQQQQRRRQQQRRQKQHDWVSPRTCEEEVLVDILLLHGARRQVLFTLGNYLQSLIVIDHCCWLVSVCVWLLRTTVIGRSLGKSAEWALFQYFAS